MNSYKIEFDFTNKILERNNKFYRFESGKLTITSNDVIIEGFYKIFKRAERYYLVTDPEIFDGKKEIPIDLLLNENIPVLNY